MDLVQYRIDDTILHYNGHTRPANGILAIDGQSGVVSLTQSPYDISGGVIESHITSTDFSDAVSHAANTKLKVKSNLYQCDVYFKLNYVSYQTAELYGALPNSRTHVRVCAGLIFVTATSFASLSVRIDVVLRV